MGRQEDARIEHIVFLPTHLSANCYVPHYLTVVVPDYLLENGVKE